MKKVVPPAPARNIVLVVTVASVVLAAAGQLLLKAGVDALPHRPLLGPTLIWTLFHPLILLGFAVYGLSAVLWLKVLSWADLSLVYPFLALSYVIVVLASWLFLHESLDADKLLGVGLIVVGVVVLAGGDLRTNRKTEGEES